MAYIPRSLVISDGCYFHVTWQCHNKDWFLKWDWSKQLYYDLLLKYKDKYGLDIHSYCFMDNHPHLSGRLKDREQFSAFFRTVNGLFARKANKMLERCGQMVMDRFKSPAIKDDRHLLTVMTYGDLNPCRAGKVTKPEQYKWSSYGYYAYGRPDPLITPPPSYLALGDTPEERQKVYREMVGELLNSSQYINISDTRFIGDPDWVLEKYREMKEKMVIVIFGGGKRVTTIPSPG